MSNSSRNNRKIVSFTFLRTRKNLLSRLFWPTFYLYSLFRCRVSYYCLVFNIIVLLTGSIHCCPVPCISINHAIRVLCVDLLGHLNYF